MTVVLVTKRTSKRQKTTPKIDKEKIEEFNCEVTNEESSVGQYWNYSNYFIDTSPSVPSYTTVDSAINSTISNNSSSNYNNESENYLEHNYPSLSGSPDLLIPPWETTFYSSAFFPANFATYNELLYYAIDSSPSYPDLTTIQSDSESLL